MAQFPHQTLAGRDRRPRQRRASSLLVVTLLMLAMVAGIPFDQATTAAPQPSTSGDSAREQSGSVPGMPNLVSPPTGTTYGTTPISVTLTWQAVSGATSYQVVINGGDIQSPWISGTSWKTPQLGNGQYSWQVQARNGNGTGNLTPKWVFWVDPSTGNPNPSPSPGPSGPSLSRSPYQGKVGTPVSVTASGFGANETVKLYWGDDSSGTFLGQAQTNGSGTGSTTITIPQDSPGWHDYTGIGQTSKKQAWGAIQILSNDPPPTSGGGGGMISPGTYAVTATEEGLVGDTTSNGHVIQPMDNFVSLPACTSTSCPWLGSSVPANCGSDCYVRVTNPDTGECAVAPVYDVGPWFTNDDYWNSTGSRILNNLSSTKNILPQGYTGADAARDGLDVGYGRANDGIGISNVGYEVGNRAAIDLAEGTWTQIGYQIGDGIGPAVVTMLWQTGEDPSSSAAACGQSGTGPSPSPSPGPGGGSGTTAVTTDSLNLRSGPGTTFPVLTVMPAGTTVTLTGQSQNGFLSVQYQNLNGWASAQYLRVNGSASPSPSPSPSPDPAVSVSPKSGAPGAAMILTATGFTPGETVAQYWGNATLAGAWGTADSTGKATINRKVPNVATGSVTLRVKGLTSGKTASTSFTVTAPSPSPSPSPSGSSATTTDNLNLRSGPGLTYSVITVIPAGATVTLTGQNQNGYSSVHYQTYDGWASNQYLKATASPSPSASPAVTVSPKSGSTGTAMTLTATGFAPGETVAQFWGDATLAGAWGTADSSGKATINRKVPNVAAGSVTLRVKGLKSGRTASTGFTVTAPSPSPSPGGNTATTTDNLNLRSGPGLSYSVITVIPAGATVTLTGQNQNGYLSVRYQTTDGWASAQYLQTTSSASPSASPAVSVSPGSGAKGTAMTLTATGFAPGETVAQYWGSATLAGAWGTADGTGRATINRTVPNVPAGAVNLRVVGVSSGRTASTNFTVIAGATLTLSPNQGPQGTKVTASGTSFPANTSAKVLWKISSVSAGTQVCTATTSSSGSFSCQFTAPSLTAGQTYVVSGVAGSQSASANFTLQAGGSFQAQSKAAIATPSPGPSPSVSPSPTPSASSSPAASPSPSPIPVTETPVTAGTPTAEPPAETAAPPPAATTEGTPTATAAPQSEATAAPAPAPTEEATTTPTPTAEPTLAPAPTEVPTVEPTPTEEATVAPEPTQEPTVEAAPTEEPTVEAAPTEAPAAETAPPEEATEAPAPTEVPQTQELDFSPVANASVSASDPDSVLPSDVLPAGGPDGDIAFVTFQVNGIGAGTVVSAKLVLTGAGENAGDGGSLGALPGVAVDEGSVTYNTAPALQAPSVAGVGWLEPGGQVVIDVTGTVTADGTITFLITGNPDTTVAIAGGASTLVVTVSGS